MTIKGTTELLTGDMATLVARVLIILGLTWNGVKQDATKENTEDIKISLTKVAAKQEALEQRVSRNEQLDGRDHYDLKKLAEDNRKELQDFKDKFYSKF